MRLKYPPFCIYSRKLVLRMLLLLKELMKIKIILNLNMTDVDFIVKNVDAENIC
jgi:hypothetical protein